MARKVKIMENEKHPLDDLKNDEITKKGDIFVLYYKYEVVSLYIRYFIILGMYSYLPPMPSGDKRASNTKH